MSGPNPSYICEIEKVHSYIQANKLNDIIIFRLNIDIYNQSQLIKYFISMVTDLN